MTDATELSPSSPHDPSTDDALLEQLLASYLELAQRPDPPALEEHCADRPDLLPALRRLVRLVRELPGGGAEAAGASDLLQGRRLGDRYTLIARLGAGAMGLVYLARDEQLGREVAVKILEDVFASDPGRVERFRREARSLASLDSPHIVAVHDLALDARPPYLVMERIRGFDLAALLRALSAVVPRDRMPSRDEVGEVAAALRPGPDGELDELLGSPWPEVVATLGVQMCAALAAAHEVGVVHRDVKPSNFMLDVHGRVRLLDFGLARRELDASMTGSAARLGTPLYMAPEQVRGEEATPLSDVYSIGATLYECLCLRVPFQARGGELDSKILYDEPVPPRSQVGRLPADLEAVCLTALAKAPERRYASAREMGADLQRFLDYEPVWAAAKVLPTPVRAVLGHYRRHRRAVAALAVIAVVAVIGVIAGGQVIGERTARSELQRVRELRQVAARIPPMTAIGNSLRDRLDDPHRAAVLADLGRILELDPEHVEARVLRLCMLEEDPDSGPAALADAAALAAALGQDRLDALRETVALLRARDMQRARPRLQELGSSLESAGHAAGAAAAARFSIVVALETGRLDEATELVNALEQRSGTTALTWWVRGIVLSAHQRDADALDAMLRSYRLCPHHANTLYALARLRRSLDPETALQHIEAALALLSEPHVNYLDQHALILRALRRFDEAEAVIRRFPAGEEVRQGLALAALWIRRAIDPEGASRREALLREAETVLVDLVEGPVEPGRHRPLAERNLRHCRALRSSEPGVRLEAYLDLAREDPLDWRTLQQIRADLSRLDAGFPSPEVHQGILGLLEEQVQQIRRQEQVEGPGR